MITEYDNAISKIEDRLQFLRSLDLVKAHSRYSVRDMIHLYEEELEDLYAIRRHLQNPLSVIFPSASTFDKRCHTRF